MVLPLHAWWHRIFASDKQTHRGIRKLAEADLRARRLAESEIWTEELVALTGDLLRSDPAHREAWSWRGRCAAYAGNDAVMKASFRRALALAAKPDERRAVLIGYVAAKRDLADAGRRRESTLNGAVIAAHERFLEESAQQRAEPYHRERAREHRRAVARWEARQKRNPVQAPQLRERLERAVYARPDHANGECPRCGGAGWIRRFRHVEGGICFRCRGSGH
jgi:hypothetical protein